MKVKKIRSELIINAPLKLVWETMFDKENTPAWSTMFQEYEMLEGNKVKVKVVMGKRTANRTAIATEYEEYKTFGWSGPFISKYLFSDNHRFFVEEITPTQTKIIQTDEMIGLLKGLVPESLYTDYDQALKAEAEKRYNLKK